MRVPAALFLVSALVAATTVGTYADTAAPLPAGKPAGVKEAALAGNGLLVVFGLAIVGGGIALVATQGTGNKIVNSTSSTRTTGTP